jgi:hypothetical protein
MSARQKYYYATKKKCYEMLGGCCIVCQANNFLLLRLDHKYGTEAGQPVSGKRRSSIQIWRDIITGRLSASEFDLLCANHHALKSAKNNDHLNRKKLLQEKPEFPAGTETNRRLELAQFKEERRKDDKRKQGRLNWS